MTHRRQAQAAAAVGNGEGDDPAPLLYCPITLTLFRESLSSSMVYIRYTKDVFGPHLKGNNSSMINHLTTGPPALRLLRQHYSRERGRTKEAATQSVRRRCGKRCAAAILPGARSYGQGKAQRIREHTHPTRWQRRCAVWKQWWHRMRQHSLWIPSSCHPGLRPGGDFSTLEQSVGQVCSRRHVLHADGVRANGLWQNLHHVWPARFTH